MSDPSTDLKQLVRRLFPGRGVELIETHISIVVLTGDDAYKFKKPVDLGFLDFSTLERRRYFCDEELRLNSRLTPELYHRVVRVTGSPENPELDGDGTVLEYGLHMLRFDREQELARLVDREAVNAEMFERLGRDIAGFHERADRSDMHDAYGSTGAVADAMRENFHHLRACRWVDANLFDSLAAWTEQQIASQGAALMRRKREGFVRECHGDMHLGNLVMHAGRIAPFDCLEFNERLRWIDTAAEVAFLMMDLDYRGHGDLAFAFLNSYLQTGGDYAGIALLRTFLVYRAMVRAKVACLAQSPTSKSSISGHMALAGRYALQAEPPTLWITFGLSGSGKTTIARRAARMARAVLVRSDVERKRFADPAMPDLYTPDMHARTYERLQQIAALIVRAGWSVILDAAFLRRSERDAVRSLARKLGVAPKILATTAHDATLRARVAQRAAEGSDASDATLDVLQRQLETHEPLTADERALALVVDTTQSMDQTDLAIKSEVLDPIR